MQAGEQRSGFGSVTPSVEGSTRGVLNGRASVVGRAFAPLLVTCPVVLFSATSEAETVRFNLINPQTNNRIKMKTVDAGTGEDVSRSELVKGYQFAKNE
ncbi:Ku protein, partial [Reyranella soli]|uniref:Ku protein n=1 Tax=Reyranella soli TaxID=1230389 RepID=UPI002811A116